MHRWVCASGGLNEKVEPQSAMRHACGGLIRLASPARWHETALLHPAGGDDEVFSITALWDRSRTQSGEDVLSCAIITMPANELLADIHNVKQRMPLILPPEAVDTWLTGTSF